MKEALSITITPQGIITAASVITALGLLLGKVFKARDWVIRQDKKDESNAKKIDELAKHHDEDMKVVNQELRLVVKGTLACLQGLQQQGCNGPVSLSIEEIGSYLNDKAHN